MRGERIADAAAVGGWALFGFSMTQVNEYLTALSLLAATFASIAAGIYYLTRKHEK